MLTIKTIRLYSILLVLICISGCVASREGTTLSGKAIKIADGDSFTLLVGHEKVRVRLYGIDCPERNQPYGAVAKKFLADLIGNKLVRVDQQDVDQYGRIVGIVWVGETNVNESILANGLAWHYTEFDQNPEWSFLERKARIDKIGLWQDAAPINPKVWRKRKK